ncbi:hypothetical protein BC826DRAFT_1111057 [Russula brevipes]|nr:hypothetical protein BC826DRAFT_1111057 [Russula brevipes]
MTRLCSVRRPLPMRPRALLETRRPLPEIATLVPHQSWPTPTSICLKATTTVQELLACSAGSSPETSLRLIIANAPLAIWVSIHALRSPLHRDLVYPP